MYSPFHLKFKILQKKTECGNTEVSSLTPARYYTTPMWPQKKKQLADERKKKEISMDGRNNKQHTHKKNKTELYDHHHYFQFSITRITYMFFFI